MLQIKFKDFYWEIYNRKFDYYYLNSVLKTNNLIGKDTIFAGSSYSIFGIEPKKSELCIGLPSQDFYYSDKLIRKVLSKGVFNRVVFIIGYYTPYCDLSKTNNKAEQQKIDDVYIPLLKDFHNRNKEKYNKRRSQILYIKKYLKFIVEVLFIFFQKIKYFLKPTLNYFNNFHSRENRKRVTWDNVAYSWKYLTVDERLAAGRKRVRGHEKFLKYSSSLEENKNVFLNLYSFLKQKKVEFDVICAPFSYEYLNGMTKEYVENSVSLKSFLMKNCDRFIDMNNLEFTDNIIKFDNSNFSCEDFVDSDHLSDSGARKFTNLVHEILF